MKFVANTSDVRMLSGGQFHSVVAKPFDYLYEPPGPAYVSLSTFTSDINWESWTVIKYHTGAIYLERTDFESNEDNIVVFSGGLGWMVV